VKNLSLTLNIILILAVAFLFYKVYQTPMATNTKPDSIADPVASDLTNRIVYLNSDSLLNNYNYFNELSTSLEMKQDSIDRLLKRKAEALEKEIMSYQQGASTMSQEEMMKTEEILMKKQQTVIDLKDRLLGYLQEEEMRMNDSIHFHLNDYLKEMNKEKNYLFILGYQRGSGILLANDSLDITDAVIKGVNGEYKQ